MISPHDSQKDVHTSKDNWKEGIPPGTSIGKSSWCYPEKGHSQRYEEFLDEHVTPNFQDQAPQMSTCGKRTPELERSLNSGSCRSSGTSPKIGMPFGTLRRRVALRRSHPMYEYNITGPFEPLRQISLYLDLWYAKYSFSVVEPRLVSPDEPGMRPVWMLTLKIHGPNSGMVIEINEMLLSMNFVGVSTCPIYYDGSIGTHALWRSKDLHAVW